jgi:peptide-methionine (S)-S-oxide reductase
MSRRTNWLAGAAMLAVAAGFAAVHLPASAAAASLRVPPPQSDLAAADGPQTVVLSGGCFWGVQGVFEHVSGVLQAVSGYAGGAASTANYETVSTGETGHAESVRITYDPKVVTFGHLLQVFFSVALDPTEVNRQGPDSGTQYRSEVFVGNEDQARVARAYIAQLDQAHVFARPIATRVDQLSGFYPAEGYHQDYLIQHPDSMYIVINDQPKITALHRLFPEEWRQDPVRVTSVPTGS